MYYLGVDGGGTKTKFIICNEKGLKITSIEKTTSHYLQIGIDNLAGFISDGINEVCLKANITKEEINNAFLGIPGYDDIKKDTPFINKAIEKAMGNIKYSIGNDGLNALAGSLAGEDGINIVAGTGSIAFGHNSDNNLTLSCGGWHHGIGSDEGSGYWFSVQLLKEFSRQSDGRDDKTILYDYVKEKLNLLDDSEILELVINNWKLDRTKVASLSKIVNELYELNDPYAIKIVDNASQELADIVNGLYKRLAYKNKIKASYSGGMFKMGDKLIKPFKEKLLPNKIELVTPVLKPEDGSIILALKNDGVIINEEIVNNLAN